MATPFPTPTGVVHIRLLHNLATSTNYGSGFDMSYSNGPPGADDMSILAAAVGVAYGAHLSPLLWAEFSLAEVQISDLAHPETVSGLSTVVHAGTRSGVPLPLSVTACLSKSINRRYRGSRPRMELPWGVLGDEASNESWDPAFISAANAAWVAFIAALVGTNFGPCTVGAEVSVSYIGQPYTVVSTSTSGRPQIRGTKKNPPEVFSVTASQLNARFGSQRRRLGRS